MVTRWDQMRATMARRFFLASVLQAQIAILIAAFLVIVADVPSPGARVTLPVAFQFGTLLLALGSWFLHRAVQFVRMERQVPFRRSLLAALTCAVLFVGVQSFGIWSLTLMAKGTDNPQVNVHGFVFMFTALHALHFIVAQSVLLWVTLSAFADRYDHEYNWGVQFAAWCWHGLGIVWIAILCVFAIAG